MAVVSVKRFTFTNKLIADLMPNSLIFTKVNDVISVRLDDKRVGEVEDREALLEILFDYFKGNEQVFIDRMNLGSAIV